jgi:hypothetical protein
MVALPIILLLRTILLLLSGQADQQILGSDRILQTRFLPHLKCVMVFIQSLLYIPESVVKSHRIWTKSCNYKTHTPDFSNWNLIRIETAH